MAIPWNRLGLVTGVVALGFSVGYCTAAGPKTELAVDVAEKTPLVVPAPAPEPLPPRDTLVDVFEDHYFPFLEDEPSDVSVSVGTVTDGYLVGGAIIPLPGRTYDILPRQCARGLMYGTDELVSLLQYTADRVYARHGTLLWLGNIGRPGGGDIPYSVSHNSGRDADIAFAYTDPDGNPVNPPDLVHLDENGVSIRYDGRYRFDAARTWTIIEAILSHPGTQVQYLFISNPLKRMLLDYARRRGVRPSMLARAEAVLGQPGRAAPHNDHLHLRIYCSREDVAGGCLNIGKVHAGTDLFLDAKARKIREMGRRLADPAPEQRARAVERLVLLRARGRLGDISKAMDDPSPRVRAAAARAVGRLGARTHMAAVSARFAQEQDPGVQKELVEAAGRLGGPQAGEMIAQVIAEAAHEEIATGPMPPVIVASFVRPDPEGKPVMAAEGSEDDVAVNGPLFEGVAMDLSGRTANLRLEAVEVAANLERPEVVPGLIDALQSEDPVLRARAARALGRVTNHRFDIPWGRSDLSQDVKEQGVEAWRGWWSEMRRRSRDQWLSRGFRARGYEVPRIRMESAWELVRAVRADDHLSYNAQRALMRLTDHRPRSLHWSRGDACWHWTRWVDRRHRKLRLPQAPAALADCNR